MNKVFLVQTQLLEKINEYAMDGKKRDYPLDWERIHMASCGRIGHVLALKRQVNPELAAIACSLHDYGRIITGKQKNHAVNGYETLKAFLTEKGQFTEDEIEALALAARNHSSKSEIGTALEEIVKDADVLDCYQYGQVLERQEQQDRLTKVLAELQII